MPLCLTDQTSRPVQIAWDPWSHGEAKDARSRIATYKARGFQVTKDDDGDVVLAPPALNKDTGVLRVLSQNGDDVLVWCRHASEEVREALKRFKDLRGQGYKFFAAKEDGTKGRRIDTFDPSLQEIIAVPAAAAMPG